MTMTTTLPPLVQCPDWCRLPAEHGWDSHDPETGLEFRGHAGPTFGYVCVGGQETSDAPGRAILDCMLDTSVPNDLSAGHLREIAADCIRAAEWLEARR
jgi:hypothetical protein